MKVLLIGCGFWGTKILERLIEHHPQEQVYLSDKDPAALARAVDWAQQRYWRRLKVEPAPSQVDACIVATPIRTHYAISRACLEAGLHVLVEKPMAKTGREAQDLVVLAAARDKVLRTDLTFLEHPLVQALQGLPILRMDWDGPAPRRTDESILWNWGPHPISIMLHLQGGKRPNRVTGQISHSLCNLAYHYDENCTFRVHLEWTGNPNISPHRLLFRRVAPLVYTEIDLTPIPQPDPLTTVLEHFLQAVKRHDTTPDWLGLTTVEVLAWTEETLARQGSNESPLT